MKSIAILFATVMLWGCATSSDTQVTDAVADFIQAAELAPKESIRTRRDLHHTAISERYAILKSHKDYHLVEFVRDCRELYEQFRVPPDYRHDTNVLHARFDTIRGCRIAKLYPIEEWQAEELKNLGDAPGD